MKKVWSLLFTAALLATLNTCRTGAAAEQEEEETIGSITVSLRRVVPAEQKGMYQYQETAATLDPAKTAVVVIDMWDRHWCRTFTARVGALVPKMNTALDAARKLGIPVLFAPSDVVGFYKDYPQRKALLAFPEHELPEPVEFNPPDPPYRVGVCECGPHQPCPGGAPWKRQVETLRIEENDFILDGNSSQELYNFCAERGVTTLLYMGVATNMCVINRAVGVRQMTKLGLDCVLVRDMSFGFTGNGFDPDTQQPNPALTPETGSQRVLIHLELFWVPSIDSTQLVKPTEAKEDDQTEMP